jgi:hypothetical protein
MGEGNERDRDADERGANEPPGVTCTPAGRLNRSLGHGAARR